MSEPAAGVAKFVVLAVPRSGSNMLCTMLDSHPEILCHHEVFNPADAFYALPLRNTAFTLGTLAERESNPVEFMERIWRRPEGRRCVGFKLTNRQNEAVFDALLTDRSIRKIVLRRGNPLKVLVSRLIAERIGHWEAYEGEPLPAARPLVRVTADDLRQDMATSAGYYRELMDRLERDDHPFVEVEYERLPEPAEQRRLVEFLDVSAAPLPLVARSVRQNSSDLRDTIENFAELAGALRGDPLERHLYDTET